MNAVLEKAKTVGDSQKPVPNSPVAFPPKVSSRLAWELGEQETFASIVWCRLDETEAVIRAYANGSNNTAAFGVILMITIAIDMLERCHESPTSDDCFLVAVHLDQAVGMMRYIVAVEADPLTDAGLTLLIVAKAILDEGLKGL